MGEIADQLIDEEMFGDNGGDYGSRRTRAEKNKLNIQRMNYCRAKIVEAGYEIYNESDKTIQFKFKNEMVTMYPYTGWHTGKTIQDGRGIEKLINQIKQK